MIRLLEISLTIAVHDPTAGAVRAVVDLLDPLVLGGAVIGQAGFGPYGESDHVYVTVSGYLEDKPDNIEILVNARRALLALPDADHYGEIAVRSLAEEDWAETWKKHYHPLRVGEYLVISPTWETPETQVGDHVIWLDPGMAFGTGTHPSTQLSLRLLERYLRPGATVLDVGTGSGILAIASLKLGAAQVVATDIDPTAITVARDNAVTNDCEANLALIVGSVPASGQYPLICVNILADVIADLLLHENLAARLAPDGTLLLAGIINNRRHVVELALASQGLSVVEMLTDGEWVGLAVRHSRSSVT